MNWFSNDLPSTSANTLLEHFSDSYFALRAGLAAAALVFPVALYVLGIMEGIELQTSMSRYFWAAGNDHCATFPTRTVFVGFLCAIGAGLYAYKGYTNLENLLLNLAGICALIVAVVPESIGSAEKDSDPEISKLFENCPAVETWAASTDDPYHFIAAVTLFVLLAIVAWVCAPKTLEHAPQAVNVRRFRRAYKILAIAMVTFPVGGIVLAYALGAKSSLTFFIEAAGVWAFGAYWIVKSIELRQSRFELQKN